jgi:hypothetical protein
MVKATFKAIAVIVHAPMQIGLSKNCNRSYLAAFQIALCINYLVLTVKLTFVGL